MGSDFDFSAMLDFDLVLMRGQCRKQTPVEDAEFIKAIDLELSKRQKRVAVTSDNKQSTPLVFNNPPLCDKCGRCHHLDVRCELLTVS